jgi:hypothetical protein
LQLLVVGALSVAAISIGLGLLAWWQRQEATTQRTAAQARRLIAEAHAELADPRAPGEGAVQKILASLALRPDDEATKVLEQGMRRLEPAPLASLPWPAGAGDHLQRLAFSPDGRQVIAVADRSIVAWSSTDGNVRWMSFAQIGRERARLVFAPRSPHAVVVVADRTKASRALLIDLVTGKVSSPRVGRVHDAAVIDERLVLLADEDSPNAIRVVDAVSGSTLWRTALRSPLQQARLVRRLQDAQRPRPQNSLATFSMMMGVEPLSLVDVALVDLGGRPELWRLDGS